LSGTSYIGSQKKSHRKPARPARTKVHRQPNRMAMAGIIIGAMMAPTLVPALKMDVASARSRRGNHRATALMAEGKLPPSLTPRNVRAAKTPPTEPATAWLGAARLHRAMETA